MPELRSLDADPRRRPGAQGLQKLRKPVIECRDATLRGVFLVARLLQRQRRDGFGQGAFLGRGKELGLVEKSRRPAAGGEKLALVSEPCG
jgi:hypothetical protein